MKKIIATLLLVAFITSCGSQEEPTSTKKINMQPETSAEYIVGGKDNAHINVYGNILSNNVKNITSNIAGTVNVLQCEEWQSVNSNTVVARITPDKNSLSYQNNLVQLNSLKAQLSNLEQIKTTTINNFDSQFRQLGLKESEIENQLDSVNNNIWNEDKGLKNQLKIIEESIVLLQKNKESSLKNIDDSIVNLKNTAFNTIEGGLKRIGEIYDITDNGNDTYEDYEDYLWVKNTGLKNQHILSAKQTIEVFSTMNSNFGGLDNQEVTQKLNEISQLFKQSSDVVNNSVSSVGSLSQQDIDALYNEFLWISTQLIELKNKLDSLVNSRETTQLQFQTQAKQLEAQKSEIQTQEINLGSNINTLNNNSEEIKEQYNNLKATKESSIKEMDINILSTKQAINQLNITFQQDVLYAGTKGMVKTKHVSQGNNVQAGNPICTIVPDDNSLKLEIYSPQTLQKGMEFKYFYDGEFAGTGTIVSESPVRNAQTQNYTYEWKVDMSGFKQGDYIDVQVISSVSTDEIWIPIDYVFPKLEWYFVKTKVGENIENKKVEVGKMNNGEILITQWVDFWDTLQQ